MFRKIPGVLSIPWSFSSPYLPGVNVADLTLKTDRIPDLDKGRKVGLAGAIDASTVIKFQAELEKLKDEGVRRFLLDMEGIRYVNSTGLGSLVKLADGLEREGGVIVLMRIHPKVKVVFDMLGLNAFFRIFDGGGEAVEYLKTAEDGKPAEEPDDEFAPEPEAVPEIEPEPVPGPVAQPVPAPEPAAPIPVVEPTSTRGREVAPSDEAEIEVDCGMCGLVLHVKTLGDHRCPRCYHVFKRVGGGNVENTGRKKPVPVQITLTGHDYCIEGLKRFVEVMAEDRGFKDADINSLREAITETFRNLVELAYDKNPELSFQVLLTGDDGEITIRVADHGKTFDADGDRFSSVQKITTEFSHVPHPNGGNIVRLTKKI
jgi:stage II sporulation protein AA (anti-sigma F factor antagonist)